MGDQAKMIYKTKQEGQGTNRRRVFMGDGKEWRKLCCKTTPPGRNIGGNNK
jgi:hypothetical protein